jgi:chloramphenicol 3-O phosphotransferase
MGGAVTPGRVILLNGVGSCGKSSIARALQEISAEPLLHVQMDAFLDMLPEALQDHPNGLLMQRVSDDPPEIAIHVGPVLQRLLDGMKVAAAAMARAGNNLIVDDVMFDSTRAEWRAAFTGLDCRWVGVTAPLEVIEARERGRGDRMIGLARGQYELVHAGAEYDMVLDASSATPVELARQIRDAVGV